MSTITQDNYRGVYHFSPKQNWMNDPNGMVFFKGEYHLFYQHHPFGTTWGPMHWGHAVSKDLVAWEELPIALLPDEHGMIFSGSAVVDWHNTTGFFDDEPGLVAIFTHHVEADGGTEVKQYQSLAYSKDSGRTWTKYAGNPVLKHESYVDFRDPKVFWHEETKRWVMIVACGQTVCIFTSPDLKDWAFGSEFGEGIGSHDGVWECPDLFPLPVGEGMTKWVMLVSIGDNPAYAEGSRTQYFTGEFDGACFKPDEASASRIRWLDHGRDNYAGVSWSDIPEADGRRLFIGWMSNWKYANQTPTSGYRGAMTTVRELELEERDGVAELIQQPARELERYRRPVVSIERADAATVAAKLSKLRLDSYEIHAVIKADSAIAFKIRTGPEQETVIGYSGPASEVYVDRSRSGISDFHPAFPGRHAAPLKTKDEHVELRILVDRSSVEVFAGGGQIVFTDLIYPDKASMGLTVEADDAEQAEVIRSLRLYELSL
ncbi:MULTISPECIES: glycoside hydrolase family 32 protein [Paenibacillus]|uniref:glycoside hydrolase family 32 protein n=1 Tax=Paenibacillus TaxID=44249 RepID=UPI0011A14161|nr:glycoside hydrolase family 32 protein [Paenibacillus sp. IHBB 10380]